MSYARAARFAATFAAMYASHQVADHWIQTDHQAATKSADGAGGRRACATHVATYIAATTAAVIAVDRLTGMPARPGRLAAALTVSALTHYWADRRTPLKRLAHRVGIDTFYNLGSPRPGRDDNPSIGTGSYALDQSWHHAWITVAAAIAASGESR